MQGAVQLPELEWDHAILEPHPFPDVMALPASPERIDTDSDTVFDQVDLTNAPALPSVIDFRCPALGETTVCTHYRMPIANWNQPYLDDSAHKLTKKALCTLQLQVLGDMPCMSAAEAIMTLKSSIIEN